VRATIGWSPHLAFDDIIASAWAWHSTHPNGFSS
jgi:UDP-glucose 4-epimerase